MVKPEPKIHSVELEYDHDSVSIHLFITDMALNQANMLISDIERLVSDRKTYVTRLVGEKK